MKLQAVFATLFTFVVLVAGQAGEEPLTDPGLDGGTESDSVPSGDGTLTDVATSTTLSELGDGSTPLSSTVSTPTDLTKATASSTLNTLPTLSSSRATTSSSIPSAPIKTSSTLNSSATIEVVRPVMLGLAAGAVAIALY